MSFLFRKKKNKTPISSIAKASETNEKIENNSSTSDEESENEEDYTFVEETIEIK